MPFPDDPADDDAFVPPLPPEDRLWRHPSEMGAHGAPRPSTTGGDARPSQVATPSRRARRGRRTGTVLVSAAAGMVVAVAVLGVIGAFEGGGRRVVVEQVAVDVADKGPVADTVGPGLARLDVRTADGDRTATAVVYRSDGHLLTSDVAVRDAEAVAATLADGRVVPATVVGADPESGVAVVRVDAGTLPTAVLGGERRVSAGDPALAVSHGPDAAASAQVEAGRVSGTGWRVDDGEHTWHGLIRATLTAPPVEGTLLCDERGTVVGLVIARAGTAAEDGSGRAEGPSRASTTTVSAGADAGVNSFAMPIEHVVRVADDLADDGVVEHSWIGVEGGDLDALDAAAIGRGGAVITATTPDGPADQAGLEPGDVVLAVDTVPVASWSALELAVRESDPGTSISMRFTRDSDPRVVLVQVAARPR